MAKNDDWLALTTEETLEPELKICDPHHHLWREQAHRTAPHYMFDEILADVGGGHNVVSTVFIECGVMYKADGPDALRPVGETEFVNGIAAMSASGNYGPARIAAGIVGHADLTLGSDVSPVLEAHIQAGGGRFRGIRHGAAWADGLPETRPKPGPHLFLDKNFQAGVAAMEAHGLSLDIWCYHLQIPDLTALARAVPGVTIILNHFGIPLGVGPYEGRADEVFETWKGDVVELAACPNVMAKLGGLGQKETGYGWQDQARPPGSAEMMQATQRYFEFTMEHFGVERCMFESNFPVDMLSCDYNVMWNSFKRLTAGYSDADKAALYHDTAARVYRL